jgi:hypothetical protein
VASVVLREPQKRNTLGSNDSRAGDEPDFGGAQCFFTKAKEAIYEATPLLLLRVDVLRLERYANALAGWTPGGKRRKTKSKRSRRGCRFAKR